jgi:VCBS repeat-containing protein
VTEDGIQTAAGHVTGHDVDNGDVLAYSGDAAGAYGSFSVNGATGEWSYALDNGSHDVQALAAGESHDEIFTVAVSDGHGGTASQDVTVTVVGSNDEASITGTNTGSVTEDGTAHVGGTLAVDDVDHGESAFDAAFTGDHSGAYGTFHFDANSGEWSYDLANDSAAVQALNGNDTRTDTLTVKSVDGTAHDVTVTVNGANEPVPPAPEPTQHTDGDAAWTVVKGQPDPNNGHIALQGTDWSNVHLTLSGTGDFDWTSEGFNITGDALASFRGPNSHNSTGNSSPESQLNFSTGDVTVTLSGVNDGSVDYSVSFTNQTQNGSSVSLHLTYDYWG